MASEINRLQKTVDDNFADWEATAFGFGYGTGEPYVLRALKSFMDALPKDGSSYDYREIENTLSPPVAWLLINRLCGHPISIIEYGTSPRHGWLTKEGLALKAYLEMKSLDELVSICCKRTEDSVICYPDACNCGPSGYEKGRKCNNPFWVSQ